MKRSPVLAALCLTGLLLAGCSAGGSWRSDAAGTTAEVTNTDVAGTAGSAAPPGTAQATAALGRVAPTSSVIRTGELEVVVEDVRAAADEAARLTRGASGTVESEERSSNDDSDTARRASAVLRLRVPPESFDATLAGLAGLGEEVRRRLGSTDVTDQVIDLDSRLGTQRASVERVRALLSEADTLGEVVQIESELTKRTADLESLAARLDALTGQVELSTITLRLSVADAAPEQAGGPLGFRDGLRAGWEALTAIGRAVGVAAGAALPFSPVVLVGAFLVWRGRSRRTAAAPASGTA
jgi:hypothetical protein